MKELSFYYDVVCPFAYLASTRVEALATRTNARLIWKPVLLGMFGQSNTAYMVYVLTLNLSPQEVFTGRQPPLRAPVGRPQTLCAALSRYCQLKVHP